MAEVQDVIDLPEVGDEVAVEPADVPDAAAPGGPVTLSAERAASQLSLLLQSLMDALPDDVVVFARQALAARDIAAAASAILFSALRFRVQVSAVEYAVLAECLIAAGESTDTLDYLSVGDESRPLLFEFVTGPGALSAGEDDEVGEAGEAAEDAEALLVDDAVLDRIEDDLAVLGVWRAWRYPVTGAAWPPPRPMYLLEVSDEAALLELAERFYGSGAAPIGMQDPLVEVYLTGNDVPALHRAVQFAGALVHTRDDDRDFIFADVFEGEPGPDGAPQEIVTVEGDDAERMLAYLMAGKPLMMADAAGDDLIAPERTGVVPLHLRTDGLWVWSDASAYYLDEHGIAPPKDFRAYLAEVGDLPDPVEDVTLHQAVAWLQAE